MGKTMKNDLHLLWDLKGDVQQAMKLLPSCGPQSGRWTRRCWGMENKSTDWWVEKMGQAPSSTTKEPLFCTSHRFLPSLFSQVPGEHHPGFKVFSFFFFPFWIKFFFCRLACGILVPWPGIEFMPPVLETWSLNLWNTRKLPGSQV